VGATPGAFPWNDSVVPPHRRVVPAASRAAACLLTAIAIGGCASTTSRTFDASVISSSAPAHGSLTEAEFKVAVAVARAEVAKEAATITSATATVGAGTVTEANDGPPCTSGTLLHIKLIGTFPHIVTTGRPLDGASSASAPSGGVPTDGSGFSVTAVLITADPASGKACLLSVQIGPAVPDPGSTLLFTSSGRAGSPAPSPSVPGASSPAAAGSTVQVNTAVPAVFVPACGHPGSQVTVTALPVIIPRALCDLTGVVVIYGETGVTVPAHGGVQGDADGTSGATDIGAYVDPSTGDVTLK